MKDEGSSNDEALTTLGGRDPAWSPDGLRIAFTADRGTGDDIWVMDADGSDQARLTSSPVSESDPAWSPDGTRIAFRGFGDATAQIVVMNANGSNPRPITSNDNINLGPAWSPDGTRIAWRHFSGGTGISVMRADGTDPVQILPSATRPNWFPDGSRLAVERSGDIWSVAPDGSAPVPLTDDPATDYEPAVSPDGRLIAFASFREAGNSEIYVMQADGSIEIRNTLTAAGVQDSDPDWQPLGPPPDITGLSRPVAGGPGATLTVDGTGFVLRSVVRWNGADRPTTYVSPTRLTAQLTAADVASAGTAPVTVFTSPAGGGLSLPRTATVDPPPPPGPAAARPSLTIVSARVTARWTRSRVRGAVRVTGAAARGGRVEIALLRGAGRSERVLQRRVVTLAGGPFRQRVVLSPRLAPGPLRVRLREVGTPPGPALTDAVAAARLAAPPEGVVRRAFVSGLQNGPAARGLSARRRIFAHFVFSARPAKGRRITVTWTRDDRVAGGATRKAFAPTVVAFIGGSSGRLPAGLYRATLRAGGTVVATTAVRLT